MEMGREMSEGDAKIRGGCPCGAVELEIGLPTKWCAHCHCSMCRRAHGAPFVTWVGVARERFAIVKGEASLVRHASSSAARRSFCNACGAMMLFEGDRWADEVHVARASIPGAIDRAPQCHVYYDSRASWVNVTDDLPKLGGENGNQPLG
jgi:hypothetical protein